MSTIIEDPDVPLVAMNHRTTLYTEERRNNNRVSVDESSATVRAKDGTNVGYRLARRKSLSRERPLVSDIALCFAVIGIVLMVLHIELLINEVYPSSSLTSQLMKLSITVSTIALLCNICWYHLLDVRLFMCDNSLEDWRLAVSFKRFARFTVELLVCAVHPFPIFAHLSNERVANSARPSEDGSARFASSSGDVDIYLAIPMLLRSYLVTRVLVLHSRLYTDASSQSLGALNRVHLNATFIFRSFMNTYPEYVLLALVVSVFLISSWTLHACESEMGMLNAMWLMAITFLTVGYGDLVPLSYCGRGVAVMTGMFGTGCTALIVAVLAHKLELTRGEKFVHNFVLDVELDKRYRVAAANIVKAGWMVYKNRKRPGQGGRLRHYQRKLLRSIHEIRDVKEEQRKIAESGVSIVEISKSQNMTFSTVQRLGGQQTETQDELVQMKQRLERIENKMDQVMEYLKTSSA